MLSFQTSGICNSIPEAHESASFLQQFSVQVVETVQEDVTE
jgi:hypothetical protein